VCAGARKAYFSLAESPPADVLMHEMSKESKKRFYTKQQVAEDTSQLSDRRAAASFPVLVT